MFRLTIPQVRTVTPETKHVLERALGLSGAERAELVSNLIESLESSAETSVECESEIQAEWNDEIRKRVEALDSETVNPIPWSVARRMISGEIDGSTGS